MNQQSGFIFSVSRYFYERITILKVEIAQKYGVFGKYFCTKNISCLETLFKKATRCYKRFLSSALFVWRACDIITRINSSFEASCPAEKPVFHFSDLGQRPKIFDQAFPPVIEQPKTNHLGKSFWEIKFHQQLVSAAAKIIFIPYHVSSAAICEQHAFDWPVL